MSKLVLKEKSETALLQPTPPVRREQILRLSLVVGAYLGLALLLTWPLVLHLGDSVPGTPYQDQDQNLWNLWWTRFSLFELHKNPFRTGYLFYPYGADLYLHTLNLSTTLLSLPFQIFGLVTTYNLIWLLTLAFTGLAIYLLAVQAFGAGNWLNTGAFVAGGFMTFAPIHLHYINSGEYVEHIDVMWLLFYAWLLFKMPSARFGWRYPLGGGLLLAMIGYTGSYYQLISAGVVGLFGLGWCWRQNRANFKAFGLNWLGIWFSFALLCSPVLFGFLRQLGQSAVRAEGLLDRIAGSGVDLLSFFNSHDTTTLLGRLIGNESRYYYPWNNFFTTYGLLAFVGVGLFFYFRQGRRPALLGLWAIIGVVFGLLALGPELIVNGERTGLPLPYRLLVELPFGKIARNPSRFAPLLLLGLALLGGFGVQQLLRRIPTFGRVGLAAVGTLLFAFEAWLLPYPMTAIDIPAGYSWLPGSGAVLDLPFNRRIYDYSKAMLYQTVHQRPILQAYLSRDVETPYARKDSPLAPFRDFKAETDIFEPGVADRLPDLLQMQGVGIIVLHRDALGNQADVAEQFLTKALGAPYLKEADERVYYQVSPITARPVLQVGPGWLGLERGPNNSRARWIPDEASFSIVVPQATTVSLELEAVAFAQERHLKVIVENQPLESLTISQLPGKYIIKDVKLKAGITQVRLVAQEPPTSPQSLGLGNDPRLLSVQVRRVSLMII